MNEIKLFIKHDDDKRDTAEIWIEAIVDGIPQNFILDTGCATTSLFYNDFSSKYSATDAREYSSAFGKSVYDSILIESVSAGPIVKTKIKIARTRKGGNDKNLFGMDLLNDLALHLSLSSNSLTVLKDFMPGLSLHDLLLDDGSIPFIDIFCGTTKAKAVWDTGAGITIVDKAFLEGHEDMFKHVGSTKGTDSPWAITEGIFSDKYLDLINKLNDNQKTFNFEKIAKALEENGTCTQDECNQITNHAINIISTSDFQEQISKEQTTKAEQFEKLREELMKRKRENDQQR